MKTHHAITLVPTPERRKEQPVPACRLREEPPPTRLRARLPRKHRAARNDEAQKGQHLRRDAVHARERRAYHKRGGERRHAHGHKHTAHDLTPQIRHDASLLRNLQDDVGLNAFRRPAGVPRNDGKRIFPALRLSASVAPCVAHVHQ